MTYTLVAVFMLTGQAYVERDGLSLQSCAGHAAMARQKAEEIASSIGPVRYMCLPGQIEVRS
jgi:hypothetical protein